MSDFKNELLNLLHSGKTNDRGKDIYEFHSPSNLYLSGEQALTYLEATLTASYQTRLAEPLRALMYRHIPTLLINSKDPICLIDLGPGVPLNTLPIINYLLSKYQTFFYLPVDISETFLTITSCFFKDQSFRTYPIKELFQKAAPVINNMDGLPKKHHRLINVGLTFNNFPLREIIEILSSFYREGDQILAASELHENSTNTVLTPYKTVAAERFNYLPLRILGFNISILRYFVRLDLGRIEMGFSLIEEFKTEDGRIINEGAEIITSVSYRHTKDELVKSLSQQFKHIKILKNNNGNVCLMEIK